MRDEIQNWAIKTPMVYRLISEMYDIKHLPNRMTPPHRHYRHFYVLCSDPWIIVTSENTSDLSWVCKKTGDQNAYILVLFWYTKETVSKMYREFVNYRNHKAGFPNHKIIFLCNTRYELFLAKCLGLPSVYCNQNCLIDEDVFKVKNSITKKYNAIYNARICQQKRQHLLKDVDNLALIVGPNLTLSDIDLIYKRQIWETIPGAIVVNDRKKKELSQFSEDYKFPQLVGDDVCKELNQARVGVILSREEGACYASAEYLLCGLPVVTTYNIGGRDVFLNGEYTRKVDANSTAISSAINDLIAKNYDPNFIRNETLNKFIPHRNRFMNLINQIFLENNKEVNLADFWQNTFVNKMLQTQRI